MNILILFYVNILIKPSDTSYFKMNGNSIPVSEWKFNNQLSNLCFAQITLDTFNYHLTCDSGFIAYTYAYRPSEGISIFGTPKTSLENEIEIIKSSRILGSVVESLNLNTEIYSVGKIKSIELWNNAPFKVIWFFSTPPARLR